ncbi:glycan metabolism protein RagB [Bacteroidia bacterium]|nr:glycan metabolism protein RagB [Bacteroidia bacterium]
MKNKLYKSTVAILFAGLLTLGSGCNDFLQLESLEKVSGDQLVQSEKGLKTLLADLYNSVPMEDFNFRWDFGFNQRGWGNGVSDIVMLSMMTDEAIQTDGGHAISNPGGGWQYFDNSASNGSDNDSRNNAFKRNRDVSIFLKNIEGAKNSGVINNDTYNRLFSEAHFVRAYIYFGLAKRYGGVPIIDHLLDDDYVPGTDNSALFIPRSTEKDTWTFILQECDLAISGLPTSPSDGIYRATKWAALGLKSRAALYAASIAKYWNKAPLAGEAANQNLVGMAPADAAFFYSACITASKEIIDNSNYKLYEPNPATPAAAATNYQNLFMGASNSEVIFSRAYLDGTTVANQGHDYDVRYSPSQANPGFHKFGRFSVTLDIVDQYEDYTDDGTGKSAKIETRTDGNETVYATNPANIDPASIPFKKYDNLYEPFKNKDARLLASVIVPGAVYKGTTIVMQGGLIKQDGSVIAYTNDAAQGKDGNTYYGLGAASPSGYSAFASMLASDDANFSSSGFSIRKYLAEGKNVAGVERASTTSWIDIRLAEIYLNYAEAVVESGTGDAVAAAKYINDLRHRAAHTDNIPLTLDNVLKERRVELAFEGLRYWDMFRRRDYHTFFSAGKRHALVPMIDLREATPKYIFVRANLIHDERAGGRTFNTTNYYFSIPGTSTNKLVQNPGW